MRPHARRILDRVASGAAADGDSGGFEQHAADGSGRRVFRDEDSPRARRLVLRVPLGAGQRIAIEALSRQPRGGAQGGRERAGDRARRSQQEPDDRGGRLWRRRFTDAAEGEVGGRDGGRPARVGSPRRTVAPFGRRRACGRGRAGEAEVRPASPQGGPLGLEAAGGRRAAGRERRAVARRSTRSLHSGETRSERLGAGGRSRSPHAHPPRLFRSRRPAALAGGSRAIRRRFGARCLGQGG